MRGWLCSTYLDSRIGEADLITGYDLTYTPTLENAQFYSNYPQRDREKPIPTVRFFDDYLV